ncbi:hypothetical protein R6Q59_028171 [Mikania micrantha]
MLVMMVFTRTRHEESTKIPANQPVSNGSGHVAAKRRRKHKSLNIAEAAEQHVVVEEQAASQGQANGEQPADDLPDIEQPTVELPLAQQRFNPPKRRGPNINHIVARTLQNFPEGTKIVLTMDKETKTFVGTSATHFATECGIVIRNWKRTRGVLSQHWKMNGGKTNPTVARSKMKPDCRSEEDWNSLCDYWESDKTRKYSDQMEANRAKQVNISRGGTRSIANHVFQMTQMPLSPLQVYYKLHFNAKKEGWLNNYARIEYENIIEHKKAAVNELTLKGTVITTTIEHNLEKEAIQSVCGKQKTLQSAWKVGVGQVLRKKDSWMNTSVQSSHQDSSSSNEDLKNQVIALKKELEHSNEIYQRMSEFISTKFPEFENMISTPVTDEAHDSEELSGDSYHTT